MPVLGDEEQVERRLVERHAAVAHHLVQLVRSQVLQVAPLSEARVALEHLQQQTLAVQADVVLRGQALVEARLRAAPPQARPAGF